MEGWSVEEMAAIIELMPLGGRGWSDLEEPIDVSGYRTARVVTFVVHVKRDLLAAALADPERVVPRAEELRVAVAAFGWPGTRRDRVPYPPLRNRSPPVGTKNGTLLQVAPTREPAANRLHGC